MWEDLSSNNVAQHQRTRSEYRTQHPVQEEGSSAHSAATALAVGRRRRQEHRGREAARVDTNRKLNHDWERGVRGHFIVNGTGSRFLGEDQKPAEGARTDGVHAERRAGEEGRSKVIEGERRGRAGDTKAGRLNSRPPEGG